MLLMMLTGYDIVDGLLTEYPSKLPVKQISSNYSSIYYDKRSFVDDINVGILVGHDGREAVHSIEKSIKPIIMAFSP